MILVYIQNVSGSAFAPVGKGKTKPNEKTMPKTRMIYSNGEKDYLPGFIKIQYD